MAKGDNKGRRESASQKNKQSNDPNCPACNTAVTSDCSGIQCDYCTEWFHAQCNNISDAQYAGIQAAGGVCTWYCNSCKPDVAIAIKEYKILKQRQDALEAKMDTLLAKLNGGNNIATDADSNLEDIIHDRIAEAMALERKRNNLVLFNLPEKHNNGSDVVIDDVIANIATELKLGKNAIAETFRFGKPGTRARLIKIRFVHSNDRKTFLSKFYTIKQKNDLLKRCTIRPDLTAKQLKVEQSLQQELKDLRKKGDKMYYISDGAIKHRPFTAQERDLNVQLKAKLDNGDTDWFIAGGALRKRGAP